MAVMVAKNTPKRHAGTHVFTSLVLPKPLHSQFKKALVDDEREMKDVLEELVRGYVTKRAVKKHDLR